MTIDNCWSKLGYNPRPVRGRKLCFDLTPYPYSKSYNPRPVRGRKSPVAPHCTQPEELQSTPRQGTEIFKTSSSVFGKPGYNPRPVRGRQSRMVHMIMSYNSYLARGRKQNKMHTLISVLIWKQAPLGDGHGVSCEHKNIGEPSQLMPC